MLLDEQGAAYRHIVLVDDGWKNILSVSKSSQEHRRFFHGVLYTGIKRDINAGNPNPSALK